MSMYDDANEPDWESICKSVQIGDRFYWDCQARREELEMLEEIRNEPPFEERLMSRAQDIPQLPAPRKKPSKALDEAPRGGVGGFFDEILTGDTGKYILLGGVGVLIGLWLLFRNKAEAQPAESENVTAYPVVYSSATGATFGFFSSKNVADQVVIALQGLGLDAKVLEARTAAKTSVDQVSPTDFVKQAQAQAQALAAQNAASAAG